MSTMSTAAYKKLLMKKMGTREKRSKYGNKAIVVDGVKYQSLKEQRRHEALKLLVRANVISDLQLQVVFVLAPQVRLAGERRAKPALRYIADFVYVVVKTSEKVIEDVKSPATRDSDKYRMKKHLMKSVHNIDITEV